MSLDDFAVKKPRRRKRLKEREIAGTVARHGRVPPIAVGYIWSVKDERWVLLGFRRWSGRMRPKNVRALRRKFAVPTPGIFRVMDLFVAQAIGGAGDPPVRERANPDTPLENVAPRLRPPAELRRIDNRAVPVTKKTKFIAIQRVTDRLENVTDDPPLYLGPLVNVTRAAAEREAHKQFTLGVVEVMAMSELPKSMRRRIRNGAIQPGRARLKFPKETDDGADVPVVQDALPGQPGSGTEGDEPAPDHVPEEPTLDRGEER